MASWTMTRIALVASVAIAVAAACSLDNRALTIGSSGQAGSAGGGSQTGGAAGAPAKTDGGADTAYRDAGGDGFDITKVVPTSGCGQDPGQPAGMLVRGTIQTTGVKEPNCADSKCGAWSYLREYYVQLPTGYDAGTAYPILFEAPSCGSDGRDLYELPDLADSVIRVGLSPLPAFSTSSGDGCWDNAEGDDSVDWAFYENLYDKLAGQLCFDRNRVFAVGRSDGAVLMDELTCKYAGDLSRPVRAVLSNGGGLPTDAGQLPTCTTKPIAGIWVNQTENPHVSFAETKAAINRAMSVNGCKVGTTLDNTDFDGFPIGDGHPDTTCQKIRGCPSLDPLIVCALPGNQNDSNPAVANPAFSAFIRSVPQAPLGCGFSMPNPASTGLPNPASYAALADGTVSDLVTGLTWEGVPGPGSYTQAQANSYCENKGDGWRLPTSVELVSLVDSTVPYPGSRINQTYFPNTPGDPFWASAPGAWVRFGNGPEVSFGDAVTGGSGDTFQTRVRCVRGTPKCYLSRYLAQTGAVRDVATGLTWQQTAAASPYTWNAAKAYCAALGNGLGNGWRLPSLTELYTIVDATNLDPAIDVTAFPGLSASTPSNPFADFFWTSSATPDGSAAAIVELPSGGEAFEGLSSMAGYTQYRVRCVR
jgi:hypothetical protein